jgi:hypothetical protein
LAACLTSCLTACLAAAAGAEGTLSLLDFALPPAGVPALCRAWLRQQLLLPPGPAEAGAAQQLLRLLHALEAPLPGFNASVPSSKIIQVGLPLTWAGPDWAGPRV